jgi:hypothetical protein
VWSRVEDARICCRITAEEVDDGEGRKSNSKVGMAMSMGVWLWVMVKEEGTL